MNQSPNSFLETAAFLGAKICREAFWSGARCNWLGPSMEFTSNAWTVVQRAYGPELYSGTSGIALFLAQLAKLTNEKVYRMTAEGAVAQALSRVAELPEQARIGFYSGGSGIVYSFVQVAELLELPQLVDEALRLTEELLKVEPDPHNLDVISGSAGAIPALLNLHSRHPRDFLLELARRHGDHLLATAHRNETGWSWNTLQTPRNLTGFSHGTAGIAWALLELHRVTGEARFQQAATEAFNYERHHYSAEHENWPDFRDYGAGTNAGNAAVGNAGPAAPVYALAWCHGAPGIGLSRLRAWELTGAEVYRQEAEAALRTTLRSLASVTYNGQEGFSLCHGLAGNAELLICASQVFGKTDYLATARRLGEQASERYRKNDLPWPCGVPGAGETPNLLLGLAGIGYFYLRLYNPAQIQSILLIPPSRATAAVKAAQAVRKKRKRS